MEITETDKSIDLYNKRCDAIVKIAKDVIKLEDKENLRENRQKIKEIELQEDQLYTARFMAGEQTKQIKIQVDGNVKIRKAEIAAETEQKRIKEQAKILNRMMDYAEKSLEIAKEAYDKKIEYLDKLRIDARDFFEQQNKSIDEEIRFIREQQEALTITESKKSNSLEEDKLKLIKCKNEINGEYEKILLELKNSIDKLRLDLPKGNQIGGYFPAGFLK